jgi:3-phosphoshikimate 1-carboxyvinyltransferase
MRGRATAPSSKSYTIRALIAAALGCGTSQLYNPLYSDDTLAAIDVLTNLGVVITHKNGLLIVRGGSPVPSQKPLNCRDSAATLRFMAAICAALPGISILEARPGLARRPITPLLEILKTMGADYVYESNRIVVFGGDLRGGLYTIKGDLSSQFISALLLIAPLVREDVAYQLDTMPRSRPYIEMTIETMHNFGVQVNTTTDFTLFKTSPQAYHPAGICIESDWSSASYLLAIGAIIGEITVEGLNLLSIQGDKILIQILQKMGAAILPDSNSVTVRPARLHAIKFDMSHCIDLLPTVAIAAATADGTSYLSGIARARLKESNRVRAICEGLIQMGIQVEERPDMLIIHGGEPRGATINSFDDHRIAMAFAVLGLKTGNTTITGAECVSKTFPSFWDTIQSLGGKIRIENG